MMSRTRPLFLSVILSLAAAGPAAADAIDGNWCLDGRRMHIAGPQIVTPGGTRMTGNYDRHGFDYVVPPREPGAGSKVKMILLGEESLRVELERPQARTEMWHRCGPPVS